MFRDPTVQVATPFDCELCQNPSLQQHINAPDAESRVGPVLFSSRRNVVDAKKSGEVGCRLDCG